MTHEELQEAWANTRAFHPDMPSAIVFELQDVVFTYEEMECRMHQIFAWHDEMEYLYGVEE